MLSSTDILTLTHGQTNVNLDDEVLRVLGSPDEFQGESRDRFVESLKRFLGDLRTRGIRDFDTIADEISLHRASFLGDQSKILALEGTQI